MSHITRIKTELKDGDVLRKVLMKLGYDLKEGGVVTGGTDGSGGRMSRSSQRRAGWT